MGGGVTGFHSGLMDGDSEGEADERTQGLQAVAEFQEVLRLAGLNVAHPTVVQYFENFTVKADPEYGWLQWFLHAVDYKWLLAERLFSNLPDWASVFTDEGLARFRTYAAAGRLLRYRTHVHKLVLWTLRHWEPPGTGLLEWAAMVPGVTQVLRKEVAVSWEAAAALADRMADNLAIAGVDVSNHKEFMFWDCSRFEAQHHGFKTSADTEYMRGWADLATGETCSLACDLTHAVLLGLLRSRDPVVLVFRRPRDFVDLGTCSSPTELATWRDTVASVYNGHTQGERSLQSDRPVFGCVADDIDRDDHMPPEAFRPMTRDGKRLTQVVVSTLHRASLVAVLRVEVSRGLQVPTPKAVLE